MFFQTELGKYIGEILQELSDADQVWIFHILLIHMCSKIVLKYTGIPHTSTYIIFEL